MKLVDVNLDGLPIVGLAVDIYPAAAKPGDFSINPVHIDGPAHDHAEQMPRVGLIPGQFHFGSIA